MDTDKKRSGRQDARRHIARRCPIRVRLYPSVVELYSTAKWLAGRKPVLSPRISSSRPCKWT